MDLPEPSVSTKRFLTDLLSLTSEHLATMDTLEHFDVLGELGRGTYGQVVLAKHRWTGAGVALKLLSKVRVQQQAFLLEFSMSLLLSAHPNIINTLIASWQTSTHFVFAQEVAPAGSLHSLLVPKVGISEVLVKRCVLQISNALHYMHSLGLVHRDVKPDNVMLMDPECRCVKLSDFGLTSLTGSTIPSMNSIIPYMAPELCSLRDPNTMILQPSIDVWALAVLMVTTLTGYFPWEQALLLDRHYKDLYWWQVRGPSAPVPNYWQRFTPQAQDCLNQMLTFEPQNRCSIKEVERYLDVPWKAENFVAEVSSESEEEEEEQESYVVSLSSGDDEYLGEVEEYEEVILEEDEEEGLQTTIDAFLVFTDVIQDLPPGTSLVMEIMGDEVNLSLGAELEAT
ncbi:serine/threonine-protein kinase SBK1-like isoform X3 [Pleurodeles waltl]